MKLRIALLYPAAALALLTAAGTARAEYSVKLDCVFGHVDLPETILLDPSGDTAQLQDAVSSLDGTAEKTERFYHLTFRDAEEDFVHAYVIDRVTAEVDYEGGRPPFFAAKMPTGNLRSRGRCFVGGTETDLSPRF